MRLDPANPMIRVLRMTLGFEAIVFGLAIAVMIQLSDQPPWLAFAATGVVMLLAILAAGTIKRPVGFVLAWLTQLSGIALGVLTYWMYWVGAGFASLFWVIFLLGKRLPVRT